MVMSEIFVNQYWVPALAASRPVLALCKQQLLAARCAACFNGRRAAVISALYDWLARVVRIMFIIIITIIIIIVIIILTILIVVIPALFHLLLCCRATLSSGFLSWYRFSDHLFVDKTSPRKSKLEKNVSELRDDKGNLEPRPLRYEEKRILSKADGLEAAVQSMHEQHLQSVSNSVVERKTD